MFNRMLAGLALLGSLAAAHAAVTYTEPPLGRLVFNTEIDAVAAPIGAYPLRLPKMGRYYAELILEPPPGTTDVRLLAPLELQLDFAFRRRDRLLHDRTVKVSFAPGERVKTLFWLEAPHMLPDRRGLDMTVAIDEISDGQLPHANLRLQITRKLEILPIVPH